MGEGRKVDVWKAERTGFIFNALELPHSPMRAYLADLTDEVCNASFDWTSDSLRKWQIMMHVLNHATDHRAQTLAMLHSLGAPTFAQDMVFYFWGAL